MRHQNTVDGPAAGFESNIKFKGEHFPTNKDMKVSIFPGAGKDSDLQSSQAIKSSSFKGYQQNKSDTSTISALKSQKTFGEVSTNTLRKKRTLHMNDYKQFKKIKSIEQRYVFGKTLGQGAFGLVRLCMHKDSGKTFAIKIMAKKAIEK